MPGRHPLHQGPVRRNVRRAHLLEQAPLVLITLVATLAFLGPGKAAGAASANFGRYSAAPTRTEPHARLQLDGDVRSRRFRSALADAYDGEADFAGRYVIAEIGCGAACIRVAALDTFTGAVRWFPFFVSGWPKAFPDPLEYRQDSRLLIVHGRLDERDKAGPYAFVFDGRSFRPE